MAYTVGQLRSSLRIYPKDCVISARIPDGPGSREEKLDYVGHHNRARGDIHDEQPVEIFAGPGSQLTVGELDSELSAFPDTSLVRVAISMTSTGPEDPGHHRVLDIDSSGAGVSDDPNEMPPVVLHTERWDSLSILIRRDDHEVGANIGDVSYAQEHVERDEATGDYTMRGAVRMTVAGRPSLEEIAPNPRSKK